MAKFEFGDDGLYQRPADPQTKQPGCLSLLFTVILLGGGLVGGYWLLKHLLLVIATGM